MQFVAYNLEGVPRPEKHYYNKVSILYPSYFIVQEKLTQHCKSTVLK